MKILYWNVCSAAKPELIEKNVGKLVEQEDIDVACLQEVPYINLDKFLGDIPVSDLISQEMNMDSVFVPTRSLFRGRKKYGSYGTAVLSRSGFIGEPDVTTLRTDKLAYTTPHPDNKRALITARTPIRPDLLVGVAHLSFGWPLDLSRNGIIEERSRLMHELRVRQKESKLIVGGDVNVGPDEINPFMSRLGLTALVDPEVSTFRSRHIYAGYAERHLDDAFVSPGLDVQAIVRHRFQSDHNPIIVTINDGN
ncbi:MAG TPA: hypothetical protein PKB09_03190 [Candidatus Saccharibacteria bacterium]|nr:hypothetical protein [Candidatus Saccharibacteria bacterium]